MAASPSEVSPRAEVLQAHTRRRRTNAMTGKGEHRDDDIDNNELVEVILDESKTSQEDESSESDEEDGPDDSLKIFLGHTSAIYSVACSPTNLTLVATGGRKDETFLWKMGHGDFDPVELSGHKGVVSTVAFSRDGKLLATGNAECSEVLIHIWDAVSGDRKTTLRGPKGGIEWIKWHPWYHYVLAGSKDCSVSIWNAESGYHRRYLGHRGPVTCGNFTPDGKVVCTGSDDATLRIWFGEKVYSIQGPNYHTKGVKCLTMTPDSNLVMTGDEFGSIKIVNIKTKKIVNSFNSHCDFITCLSMSPSYCWLASGSLDFKLIIWNPKTASPRVTCEHEDMVTCMIWIGESHYIATGSVDGKVRVWDAISGECVRIFRGHRAAIQELSLSAHRRYLVSVSLDGTARVFEVKDFHFQGINIACKRKWVEKLTSI